MIHEGTNGIQALDLLGRKAVMKDGAATKALATAMAKGRPSQMNADLAGSSGRPRRRRRALWHDDGSSWKGAISESAAGAGERARYLNMVGHTVVAWLWLREAAAAKALTSATGADVPFYEGKIATARFFFGTELREYAGAGGSLGSLETALWMCGRGTFRVI